MLRSCGVFEGRRPAPSRNLSLGYRREEAMKGSTAGGAGRQRPPSERIESSGSGGSVEQPGYAPGSS
jgi:hypothetical protein